MTVIELIRLLRKVENKGKDVKYIGQYEVTITSAEEVDDAIILK